MFVIDSDNHVVFIQHHKLFIMVIFNHNIYCISQFDLLVTVVQLVKEELFFKELLII